MAARKKPPGKPPKQSRGRRSRPRNHNDIITLLLIAGGIATLLIGSGLGWFLSLNVPDIRSFDDYRPPVATTLLDHRGNMIGAIYEQNRVVLRYEEMQPLIPQAFVAAEDGRYWEHGGLDVWSIFRALIRNLQSGHRAQGGSTITQQVTRSLMLNREKSYSRKIKEALLAYRLDKMLSKEDILAIYLSEIYLGEGAYGVEAAARTYFNKRSDQLELAEVALLAGLPQSPSRYSPLTHFEEARARQRYVLNRMADEGYISPDEARQAFQRKLRFHDPGRQHNLYGYFTQYVRQELEKKFGAGPLLYEGLTVTTTIDPFLQEQAVKTVREGSASIRQRLGDPSGPQAALVAIEPKTGRIRAMTGGTDFNASPFNRAVQAKRQPGSVFKPLIYTAAFEKGLQPELLIDDSPLTISNPDGSSWTPRNWSRRHYGPTTLRDGLVFSRNIVTVKLLRQTGVRGVVRLAENLGITSRLEPELTLALGTSPVSVLEMTGAYTVFANGGKFMPPVCITAMRDRYGDPLPWTNPQPKQVISSSTARLVADLLEEVISRGTGQKARGVPDSAGKTGTTDDNRDGWFIGFTPGLLAGVWVGHDQGRSLGRGETGGESAAPIWLNFMRAATRRN
ncbi:MAG: PBP1A family penicillin-binding protein [Desulfobulbaceae bacterium]|nr:PBP1A family penicillin-binding protein [Desulfobulbaceae bacterium]